jgi:hypothetical protein
MTCSQGLLLPSNTWSPIDALQLHASMWTGYVVPSLDSNMLPLAGTNIDIAAQALPPSSLMSPLASTSATLAVAAASEFTRENLRKEHISDVHFQSPWALGGVSRLQSYIHTLTCSVATAQIAVQQLLKEFKNHSAAASASIGAADQDAMYAHRVETGDTSMVLLADHLRQNIRN